MDGALAYNERQGFCGPEIQFIQRLVGSTADGRWGPRTLAALGQWQASNGLADDRKIWRSLAGATWPAMLQHAAEYWREAGVGVERVGLWARASSLAEASWEAEFERARAAGISDIVFTINDRNGHEFSPSTTMGQLTRVGHAYRSAGIEVSLNAFVFPSRDYVSRLADFTVAADRELGLRRLDLDVEGLWVRHAERQSPQAAAGRLDEALSAADIETAVHGGVSTQFAEIEALVHMSCTRLVTPRAYSVAGEVDASGRTNTKHNPIVLQARAARLWSRWAKPLVGGFTVHRQAGRYELGELDEAVALGLALRGWADMGVREVCGWSLSQCSEVAARVLRGGRRARHG